MQAAIRLVPLLSHETIIFTHSETLCTYESHEKQLQLRSPNTALLQGTFWGGAQTPHFKRHSYGRAPNTAFLTALLWGGPQTPYFYTALYRKAPNTAFSHGSLQGGPQTTRS